MTRETKIGLLVGLAFIIVIGILLSDHLSAIEPAPAQLAGVGDSVRSGAAVPPAVHPPITLAAQPIVAAPGNPVPTRVEIAPQPAPRTVVQISGSNGATAQPISITATNLPQPTPANPARDGTTSVTQTPTHTGSNALAETARQHGDEIVDVATGHPVTLGGATTQPTNTSAVNGKQYQALANDTVSKMALKFYGANTKTTRELIINANPTLKGSPDKIVVGKTYVVPTQPGATLASSTVAPARLTIATPIPAPAPASTTTYTVKENDTLWKIATTQLGNGALSNQIKDLNRDTLKNGDTLKIGMTLKLPSKTPVITASARD